MVEINKIYCMDALELLKQLPDNSVDLVLTDPPYNINFYSNHGCKEYRERIQTAQEWDNNFDFKLYFNDLFRVLKDNCYMYVFGCFENIELMKSLGCKEILIWNKDHCGMGNLKSWGIGYEYIFLFEKGSPYLRGHRVNGVITSKHIGFFDATIHPTQKPEKLMRFLIEKSSDENNLVLDCFIGGGQFLWLVNN